MKTIKLVLTLTAAAIIGVAAAVEKPKMNVVPLTAERAVVSVSAGDAANFELSIKTASGDVVYYKQSEKPLTDYRKVFDFENIQNGNYVLSVKVNGTTLSRDIEVDNSGITVGTSKTSFDPYFGYKDNVLKFSYLNFDEENMKLRIYDSNYNLIYTSNIGNDFAITTGYDLKNLQKGNYTVEIASPKNQFKYELVK